MIEMISNVEANTFEIEICLIVYIQFKTAHFECKPNIYLK